MSSHTPNALERRYPDLRLPRLQLGDFPTPIERLPISPGGTTLWCKREDLSGPHYGGNKVRKLEYLLARAGQRGRSLLTIGGDGSHHLLATAYYAQQIGLDTYGVFAPQPRTPHVAVNRQLLEQLLAGWQEVPFRVFIPAGMLLLHLRLLYAGVPSPESIAAGGSNPLGTVGWVAGGLEIADQVHAGQLPEPDEIWVPLGSGGNAAGLLLGLRLAGLRSKVMAVRVVEFPLITGISVMLLARRTTGLLRARGLEPPPDLHLQGFQLIEGFLGRGYGHETDAARDALQLARDQLGLDLDGTYTSKCLAACLAHLAAHRRGGTALFLDTVNSRPTDSLVP